MGWIWEKTAVNLTVEPKQMETKASEITELIAEVKKAFQEIESSIDGTKGYWKGQASDKHYKMFWENKDEIEEVIKRLEEHPRDLLEMAGIYEEAERANVELAQTLQADIIE